MSNSVMGTNGASVLNGNQTTSNMAHRSILDSTGFFRESHDPLSASRQKRLMKAERARQKVLYIEPEESEDDAGGAFTANPADDIPRNKLTEKLARGI
jgi:hypothetical protein